MVVCVCLCEDTGKVRRFCAGFRWQVRGGVSSDTNTEAAGLGVAFDRFIQILYPCLDVWVMMREKIEIPIVIMGNCGHAVSRASRALEFHVHRERSETFESHAALLIIELNYLGICEEAQMWRTC